MANTTLTADILAKIALPILKNELGVLAALYREPEKEFQKSVNGYKPGSTINVRRPADFTIRSGATASVQDVVEGKQAITVDTQKGIDFAFTSEQLTLDVAEMGERVMKPAMIALTQDIARDIFDVFYKRVYNWAGTPGQTVNSFGDFTKAPLRLEQMAVPGAGRHALLDPVDYYAMLDTQSGIFVANAAKEALREGELGMLSGMRTWHSNITPSHTVGDHGGTPLVDAASQNVTYDTAKNSWTQTLITDGWDTSVVLSEGDVFTIADVYMVNPRTKVATTILQQFVLTADVTTNASAAADTTLTISPPIISSGVHQTVDAAPADNAAIVYVGTANTAYPQNLAFHENAMALTMVPMELPQGAVNPGRASEEGMSVRIIPYYAGGTDLSSWRLDVLYGRVCLDARLAARFSGTA